MLLVDDDADLRMIAEIALARIGGLTVRSAASAEGARAALAETRPDAILLDVGLPDLEGPLFADELARGPFATVPIVFLSGTLMQQHSPSAPQVRGALLKPFDPMTLAASLAELVGWT